MSHTLIDIFSYSIAIGAIIGLIRFGKIDQIYYPFVLLLWVGLLNEITGTITIRFFKSNAVSSNVYVLTEAILILLFFKNLGLFNKNKRIFYVIGGLFIAVWAIENFIISSISRFGSYFRIFYSFIIVLMSIHLINRLLLEERKRLIKNSVFLIMIGFIAFFTYKILIEIFWVYGLNATEKFQAEVYRILAFINLTVNFIFALAVLWIPRKREYILP